jgi:two-component system, NtrC family, sensor kinase
MIANGSLSIEQVLATVEDLALQLSVDLSEPELAQRVLAALGQLFPGRLVALRVLDLRSAGPMRLYSGASTLRPGVDLEPFAIDPALLATMGLKSALLASARLHASSRWESPFVAASSAGFVVPLVAVGEFYGLLDIGTVDRGGDPDDDPGDPGGQRRMLTPVVTVVALALRSQHLYRDTAMLRDFQSRLIESAGALIIGVDRTWRISICNRAMAELTGYLRDEMVGRDLRDWLVGIPDRDHLLTVIAAAIRGDEVSALTIDMPCKDSSRVRTCWTLVPVGRGRWGQPAVFHPSQDALVESVVLIGQDQSRVHELQQQVIRSERLATIGELSAGVVHELNNPLTSITVYADFLQRKLEREGRDPQDLEKLRRIGSSAQRILRFSRDLVQYARPSSSASDDTDLCAIVEHSLAFCEHLLDPAKIELRCELSPVPKLSAIKDQLEQVVVNLLTNAVHAVSGCGVIAIRVRRDGPSQIALAIEDSGPGVAAQDRDRIFEPFFTTKADGKGTGLGLSIVRNIVDQHHGCIEVSASDLGGASFVVTLPVKS